MLRQLLGLIQSKFKSMEGHQGHWAESRSEGMKSRGQRVVLQTAFIQ